LTRTRRSTVMRMATTISPLRALAGLFAVLALLLVFPLSVGDRYSTESRAIQGIKTIHQVQSLYFSQYGRWAGSLDQLRGLLPDELVSRNAYGYRFRMHATAASYDIQAEPLAARGRTFHSDQTMTLRDSTGKPVR
jgi:hypothetical protein